MSDETGHDPEHRLTALLSDLRHVDPPAPADFARHVVRRARRQRAVLAVVQLLVVVARTVRDAIAIGAGRRR